MCLLNTKSTSSPPSHCIQAIVLFIQSQPGVIANHASQQLAALEASLSQVREDRGRTVFVAAMTFGEKTMTEHFMPPKKHAKCMARHGPAYLYIYIYSLHCGSSVDFKGHCWHPIPWDWDETGIARSAESPGVVLSRLERRRSIEKGFIYSPVPLA